MKAHPPFRPVLLRYSLALAVTALSFLIRLPLWPLLGDTAPYIQNYPAIMISAWFGGMGPGLFATLLGALGTTYYLLYPIHSLAAFRPSDQISLGMYVVVGALISALNEALHRSRRELQARIEERTADLTIANEILRDEIRDRKRIEADLLQTSEEFRDLYNRAPCGYHSLDENGVYLRINDTELGWLGYEREEVIGKLRFPDLLTEECRLHFNEHFPLFKESGRARDIEYEVVRKDGTTFPVLLSADAIYDGEGRYLKSRAMMMDRTERKRVEGLAEANRYKDQFLAVLGHELRNPLGAMTNALYLLRHRAGENPDLLRACDLLERQIRLMTRLIDDLRDVARINRGKLQIDRRRLDLREVVNGSVEATRPLFRERNHDLDVRLPPEPCWIMGDGERLTQVFTNLLDNAAKYTDPGGRITVVAEKNGSHAAVDVRDSGIGIPPESLPLVFHLYAQADSALARSQGGLGIGLSLVKGLVEMHGGEVSAHSDGPGQGSDFRVTLPLAEP